MAERIVSFAPKNNQGAELHPAPKLLPHSDSAFNVPPMTTLRKAPLTTMPDVLNTPRLALRPLRLSDATDFSVLANDFDIGRMTGSFPHPFPQLSAEFFIMKFAARRARAVAYPYAITKPSEDRLLGVMDIFKNTQDQWELGYWLGRPAWGQGFATEAGAALIDTARTVLGVQRIEACVFTDNPGSARVLEKLGFKQAEGGACSGFSMSRMESAPSQSYLYER